MSQSLVHIYLYYTLHHMTQHLYCFSKSPFIMIELDFSSAGLGSGLSDEALNNQVILLPSPTMC